MPAMIDTQNQNAAYPRSGNGEGPVTFSVCLLPPAFLPEMIWTPTADRLRQLGHEVIMPQIDRSSPELTLEDDVKVVEKAMTGRRHQVVVALSRAIEIAIRYVDPARRGADDILNLQVVASGGPKGETYDPEPRERFAERYTPEYSAGLSHQDGLEVVDPGVVNKAMLHDLEDEEVRDLICRRLTGQRPVSQSEMQSVPPVPTGRFAINWDIGLNDRVHNLEREAAVARQKFGIEPVYGDFGHVSPLTHPQLSTQRILGHAYRAYHAARAPRG